MTDYRVQAGEAQEDQVSAAIESYTSKIPSTAYLGAAIASIIASVSFKIGKKDHAALFVGQWVAPFLILGLYNKLVKLHGSDATTRLGSINAPTATGLTPSRRVYKSAVACESVKTRSTSRHQRVWV